MGPSAARGSGCCCVPLHSEGTRQEVRGQHVGGDRPIGQGHAVHWHPARNAGGAM